ncbi:MAG: Sec-independent protein translocase protein TatB [Pseudomonadota bacterium]|nr:Sec-independent protein translocase protein TatB [Pseudomonadota bacterium]
MLDIGGWEFLVVAFVLIMVVGPKELPRMLRSFTQFTRQMRKMAREFTDGMNQIATDAEVAELKKAMDKAKGGDLDELAEAIDTGGEVGGSVRELKNAVDKDAAAEDMKEIGELAGEAGRDIADDATRDEAAPDRAAAPARKPAKTSAGKKS